MKHQPSAISHQPSAISHQPSAISRRLVVGTRFISVRKRLFPANTLVINLTLIFCLLLILSGKSAIAYELKWSTTIIVSGQQSSGNYSLQGISSFVSGPPATSPTYTVISTPLALPPQQATFATFTATPVSSAMVRLDYDLTEEEYYSLQFL